MNISMLRTQSDKIFTCLLYSELKRELIKEKITVEDNVLEKAVDKLDETRAIYYAKDDKKILKMWRIRAIKEFEKDDISKEQPQYSL